MILHLVIISPKLLSRKLILIICFRALKPHSPRERKNSSKRSFIIIQITLFSILEVKHPLKALQGCFWIFLLKAFAVVVLVLQVNIRFTRVVKVIFVINRHECSTCLNPLSTQDRSPRPLPWNHRRNLTSLLLWNILHQCIILWLAIDKQKFLPRIVNMAIQQKQPCETEYHLNQNKQNNENIYVDLAAKVERKSTAVENQFYWSIFWDDAYLWCLSSCACTGRTQPRGTR